MRFYQMAIYKDRKLWVPPSMKGMGDTKYSYSSFYKGDNNTSALHVYMDIPMEHGDQPAQGALVRIFGVGLQDIAQSSDLLDANILIKGGMKKGLPLAKPKVPDLLVTGRIEQCFGNWQGTLTSLDMVLNVTMSEEDFVGENDNPNLVLNWKTDQPLSEAIEQMLADGYPGYEVKVSISDKLKWKGHHVGYWGGFVQVATQIKALSMDKRFQGIKRKDGSPYRGVSMDKHTGEIVVTDGTSDDELGTKEIEFTDLIGQPTWIAHDTISFKTVLRGDINLNQKIKLPESLATPYVMTAPGAGGIAGDTAASRNRLAFKGTFEIKSLRHIAQFRQADADSWATVIEAFLPGQDETGGTATETKPAKPSINDSVKSQETPSLPFGGKLIEQQQAATQPFGAKIINLQKITPKPVPPQTPTPANIDNT